MVAEVLFSATPGAAAATSAAGNAITATWLAAGNSLGGVIAAGSAWLATHSGEITTEVCPFELEAEEALGGIFGEAYWTERGGRILEAGEYPEANYPIIQQVNDSTCGPACGAMAEQKLTGIPSDLLENLKDSVPNGMFLEDLAGELENRGLNTNLQNLPTLQAIQTMQDDLEAGDAVIAAIPGHAVHIHDIEPMVGNDFRIFIDDPDTGKVIEFTAKQWLGRISNRIEFLSITP